MPSEFTPYQTHPRDEDEVLFRMNKIINDAGWVETTTPRGCGGVGNTLEHLLGIEQNSHRGADAGGYEIKSRRSKSGSSLMALFSFAPFPRTESQNRRLLEMFGWEHSTRDEEDGFYLTLSTVWNERGFRLNLDRDDERVYVEYDRAHVAEEFADWADQCPTDIGTRPYWEFDDLRERAAEKVTNLIFVTAESRDGSNGEEFNYQTAELWLSHSFDEFLTAIESRTVQVEFQIRSGKDYGTRFSVVPSRQDELYEDVVTLDSVTTNIEYADLLQSVQELQETATELESVSNTVTSQVDSLVERFSGEA